MTFPAIPSISWTNLDHRGEKYFGGDNVDRNMDLIKIVDATTGEAMGLLNWYGVHPTSMTSLSQRFMAFRIASRRLQSHLGRQQRRAMAGLDL